MSETLSCITAVLSYSRIVKTLTIRLPASLAAEIEQESRSRRVSKSDIVRERLTHKGPASRGRGTMKDLIGDLIGSVPGLPADLSRNKKKYLPALIRGAKHLSR